MSQSSDKPEEKTSKIRLFGAGVILLMIVLMMFPINLSNKLARASNGGTVIGSASNGRTISSVDRTYGANLLATLESLSVVVPGDQPHSSPRTVPMLAECWNATIVREFRAKPEILYLLLDESRRVSPGINPLVLGDLAKDRQSDEAPGLFNSGIVPVAALHPMPSALLTRTGMMNVEIRYVDHSGGGRSGEFNPKLLPQNQQEQIYQAMSDFLTIQSAASLPLNAVKVSTPIVDRNLASKFQRFAVQLAAFDAHALEATLPAPTDEQLQAHFKQYAAFTAGALSRENPFGFGYRVPDRVKLQLISVKRSDVRKLVEAEKTPYQWEVDARMDFQTSPGKYAMLLSTTQPTSQPATQPAVAALKPFDSIKDLAVSQFIDAATDGRMADIERRLRSTMVLDYQAWATARNTHATIPSSTMGVPYDSVDYLNRLAADIASRSKVQPIVENYTDRPRDAAGLGLIGGFDRASFHLPPGISAQMYNRADTRLLGPGYATAFAKDLQPAADAERLGDLALENYAPSERLDVITDKGQVDEIYHFRLTEADPNHAATDLTPIRDQVTADWRRAEAQRLAMEKATAAADNIRKTGRFEAPGAALTTVNLGPFASEEGVPTGLNLSASAYPQFVFEVCDKLLGGEPMPVAALSVPLAQQTYAARRVALSADWSNTSDLETRRQEIRGALSMLMSSPRSMLNPSLAEYGLTEDDIVGRWLDRKKIESRNEWKPAKQDATTEP